MENILSITSQGWILLLLVSLFSVGSEVLFIEASCYNNNNSYYTSKTLTNNPLWGVRNVYVETMGIYFRQPSSIKCVIRFTRHSHR